MKFIKFKQAGAPAGTLVAVLLTEVESVHVSRERSSVTILSLKSGEEVSVYMPFNDVLSTLEQAYDPSIVTSGDAPNTDAEKQTDYIAAADVEWTTRDGEQRVTFSAPASEAMVESLPFGLPAGASAKLLHLNCSFTNLAKFDSGWLFTVNGVTYHTDVEPK